MKFGAILLFKLHQTSRDQFFDEAQFEAYRMLGECVAESLFRDELLGEAVPETLQDWFQLLANNLLRIMMLFLKPKKKSRAALRPLKVKSKKDKG